VEPNILQHVQATVKNPTYMQSHELQ